MRLYRAKKTFVCTDPDNHRINAATIFKGQAFVVNREDDLPQPVNDKAVDCYEQIVPKNMLFKLDAFVKAVAL